MDELSLTWAFVLCFAMLCIVIIIVTFVQGGRR